MHFSGNLTFSLKWAWLMLKILVALTPGTKAGFLLLNPNLEKAVRLAGEDNSFFISCLPQSSMVGPIGDSRIRARELSWKKRIDPPIGNGNWVVLGTQPHERVHVEQSADGRGLDLVFRSIKSEDGGRYKCEATLDSQLENSSFELKVIEPISFDEKNRIQSVEDGRKDFELLCNVRGNPRPEITWNVRGKIIRGAADEKYQIMDNGSLRIRNVGQADKGTYKCKATQMEDGITDFRDMVIQLKVQHKPEWPAAQRGQFYGYILGIANLTCEAKAEPPASFRWLDMQNNEISAENIINEDGKSILKVPIMHEEAFGDYTCIATNNLGTLRKIVTLTEGAKPGVPTLETKRIGHESAVMSIQENRAEMFLEIVGFRVEIKNKTDDWSNARTSYFPKDPSNSYNIAHLSPKTTYEIRARAKNLAGLSDSSNIIWLQTKSPHTVGELLGSSASRPSSSFVRTRRKDGGGCFTLLILLLASLISK